MVTGQERKSPGRLSKSRTGRCRDLLQKRKVQTEEVKVVRRILITAAIVVAFLGGIFAYSQLQPQRLTASVREKALENEKLMKTAQAPKPAEQAQPAKAEPAPKPKEQAPQTQGDKKTMKVKFETTKGDIVIEFNKDWAPNGVKRIEEMLAAKVLDNARFFRVVPGFVVQFGIAADPAVAQEWWSKNIKDDAVKQSNAPGTVTFAKSSLPNSRSTQLFINLGDNSMLDSQGFAPIGKVVEGMEVVRALNGKYADAPTSMQQQMVQYGATWLDEKFPGLDSIKTAAEVQ
jgi:cyclophilin family peptidyl-prolyl cis-trans isomerase